MESGKIKLYTATATALFLLSPLLALPYIMCGIYRQEKSAYFLFSLFLGFLAWLQIPLADLFRHTLNFYNYLGKPFSYVYLNKESIDYFIPMVNWLLSNLDIPYQYFRLFSITESFYLLTIIFNYMINSSSKEYTQQEAFVRFCIMFLFFEFIMTTSGVRYGFAVCQYVYAVHLVINRKSYVAAAIFALFASQIHVAFTFFIPISLLLYSICRTRNLSIALLVGGSFVLLPIIARFSYLLGRRADWYFASGTSISDHNNISIYGFILFIAVRLFLIPFLLIEYQAFTTPPRTSDKLRDAKQLCDIQLHASKWVRIAFVWAGITLLFITNMTMIFRTSLIFATMGVFALIAIEETKYIHKKWITVILICGMLTTLFSTVNNRAILLNSRFQYIAMPTFVILQNQYDKQWIIEHVNGNKMKE